MSTPEQQIEAQRRVCYHSTIQERHLIGPEQLTQLFNDSAKSRIQGLHLATLCDMVLGDDANDRSDRALMSGVRNLLKDLENSKADATQWREQCERLVASEKRRLDEARKAATWRT